MSNLDQIVKGAPPPGTSDASPSNTSVIKTETSNPSFLSDPLANLPSSPPQIYLNLLILEASLRAQYLQLRTRRRQHTFFLGLLGLWVSWFSYVLFLQPREDGKGVGGSVYWVVDVAEKLCFIGGIVTAILVWGTGTWARGIRWPRRWVYTTNRGLRVLNCKLVVIKQPLWREFISTVSFLFSYGLFSGSSGSSYRFVDHTLLKESEKVQSKGCHHALPDINEDDEVGHQEDLAPGGDYIKLLLLAKPFSPTFRENWDTYRSEYWEKENERRAELLEVVKARDRKLAKEQGGWLWWTGYRGWNRGKASDPEKTHHQHHSSVHRQSSVLDKDHKRTRSSSVRAGSHSRNSSRSSTPTLESEDPTSATSGGRVRRASNTSTSDRRRKMAPSAGSSKAGMLTPVGSRTATPDVRSPLAREGSFTSISSVELDRPDTATRGREDAPLMSGPTKGIGKRLSVSRKGSSNSAIK
ncbi:Spo7-like protein-domain-containing protein [Amylocarpus encephaloides]|uniref:Spo7-like protein-domain-containing protein n=1 Tax=Amylocarpus encephaloides TaxID=45428 RepID=A0A9P7Y6N5_9HELO|nr:Spo7-like protein-domain-containing protein [Amylocarpus encephaloides]